MPRRLAGRNRVRRQSDCAEVDELGHGWTDRLKPARQHDRCSGCSPRSTASWRDRASSAGGRGRPAPIERSTYVLLAGLRVAVPYWLWQPIPSLVWVVRNPIAVASINAVFWFGWGMLIVSTFLISHFELLGLSQVFARLLGRSCRHRDFARLGSTDRSGIQIYLSFLLAFWAAPSMTQVTCCSRWRPLAISDRHPARRTRSHPDVRRSVSPLPTSRSPCWFPLPGRGLVDRTDT